MIFKPFFYWGVLTLLLGGCTLPGKEAAPTKSTSSVPLKSNKRANLKPVIVIDPGHGGDDLGAVGDAGLLEKDVTLDVAKILKKMLEEKMGAEVKLTRTTDVHVPLSDRTKFANEVGADVFLSLHTNATPRGNASGLETYYLDNSDDKGSKLLAERENSSVKFEGPSGDLQYILSDLIQAGKLDDSVRLAHKIQDGVIREARREWGSAKSLGVKKAPFYVLVGAHAPCVLVEMFFIDSPVDGPHLSSDNFRQRVAEGIFSGVQTFINSPNRVAGKGS